MSLRTGIVQKKTFHTDTERHVFKWSASTSGQVNKQLREREREREREMERERDGEVVNGINVRVVSERQTITMNKQHTCLNVHDKYKEHVCWSYIKPKSNPEIK